jgi:hypothetical protein
MEMTPNTATAETLWQRFKSVVKSVSDFFQTPSTSVLRGTARTAGYSALGAGGFVVLAKIFGLEADAAVNSDKVIAGLGAVSGFGYCLKSEFNGWRDRRRNPAPSLPDSHIDLQ